MNTQTQQPQFNVPTSLIEALGTGEDTIGIVGKRIRVIQDSEVHPLARLFGLPTEPALHTGAEGTVIHVDSNGVIWADFGNDERITPRDIPEGGQRRLQDVGNVDPTNEDFITLYELA